MLVNDRGRRGEEGRDLQTVLESGLSEVAEEGRQARQWDIRVRCSSVKVSARLSRAP